jgi:transcriptional regulator with XRE-family HTH domain
MAITNNLSTFGEHLRNLRETQHMTLKNVAEKIGIDTSLLAKIERNERPPTKHIIKSISNLFNCDEKQLSDSFLSDLIAYKMMEEEADLDILKIAEEKVKYFKTIKNGN